MLELPIFFLSPSILTPDIGSVEYYRARKSLPIDQLGEPDGADFRPRPELFGSEPPFGFPTVCRNLSKQQLNEIYDYATATFFLRESTYARIMRLTPANRRFEVDLWYEWVQATAEHLSAAASFEPIRRRASALPRIPTGSVQR
jgi:hypothetical protein